MNTCGSGPVLRWACPVATPINECLGNFRTSCEDRDCYFSSRSLSLYRVVTLEGFEGYFGLWLRLVRMEGRELLLNSKSCQVESLSILSLKPARIHCRSRYVTCRSSVEQRWNSEILSTRTLATIYLLATANDALSAEGQSSSSWTRKPCVAVSRSAGHITIRTSGLFSFPSHITGQSHKFFLQIIHSLGSAGK